MDTLKPSPSSYPYDDELIPSHVYARHIPPGGFPMPSLDLEALHKQLIEHEGCKLYAYVDSLGYWTIGVGRLIDKAKGGGITSEEAEYLLNNDINKVILQLDESLPWWTGLDPLRRRVLIDMCFQMGLDGLLDFENTLRFIERGSYKQAGVQMRKSRWYTQTKNRAERLAQMMETGEDVPKWW